MKKIKIYADGADYKEILKLNKSSLIKGFTTNPSLMRKSGVKSYADFAKKILKKYLNQFHLKFSQMICIV